jgi:hypothetical protein
MKKSYEKPANKNPIKIYQQKPVQKTIFKILENNLNFDGST